MRTIGGRYVKPARVTCLVGDGTVEAQQLWDTGTGDARGKTNTGAANWPAALTWAEGVLAAHGLKLGPKLGCGSYGCAYIDAVNPTKVIKITGDAAEAASAQTVVDAVATGKTTWGRLPALGKIDCVYAIGKPSPAQDPHPALFVVMQEKVAGDLPYAEAMFVNDYRYSIALGRSDLVLPRARERLGPAGARNVQRVMSTIEELARIGVDWSDVSSGNVLAGADGTWTIVDLGASDSAAGTTVTLLDG